MTLWRIGGIMVAAFVWFLNNVAFRGMETTFVLPEDIQHE